jgi:hypothetical protein
MSSSVACCQRGTQFGLKTVYRLYIPFTDFSFIYQSNGSRFLGMVTCILSHDVHSANVSRKLKSTSVVSFRVLLPNLLACASQKENDRYLGEIYSKQIILQARCHVL